MFSFPNKSKKNSAHFQSLSQHLEEKRVGVIKEFEEKTESTKIFLPSSVESGVYQFYVQVSYGSYVVKSYRTIELEVGDGIATFGPSEQPEISIPLIIIIILIILLLSRGEMGRIGRNEKKINGFTNLSKILPRDFGEHMFYSSPKASKNKINKGMKNIIKPEEKMQIPEKEKPEDLIEEAIEETEKKNRERKAGDDLIDEVKKKDGKRK